MTDSLQDYIRARQEHSRQVLRLSLVVVCALITLFAAGAALDAAEWLGSDWSVQVPLVRLLGALMIPSALLLCAALVLATTWQRAAYAMWAGSIVAAAVVIVLPDLFWEQGREESLLALAIVVAIVSAVGWPILRSLCLQPNER